MEKYIKFEDRFQLYESVVKDLELKMVKEFCYPDINGSYFITFSAGEFLIRYDNSRYGDGSELAIQVASNSAPSKWYDLSFIKNFINKAEKINPGYNFYLKNIMELNDFLKSDFNKIAELLNQHNYRNTFKQIDALLIQELKNG